MSPPSPEGSGAPADPPTEDGAVVLEGDVEDTRATEETNGMILGISSSNDSHIVDGPVDDTTGTGDVVGPQPGQEEGDKGGEPGDGDAVPQLPSFATRSFTQHGRTSQSQSMSALLHSSGGTRKESYESDSSLPEPGTTATTSTGRASQAGEGDDSGETALQRRRPPGARGLTESQSFSDLRLPKPNNPVALAARTHLANALDKLRGDISITPRKPQSGTVANRGGPKLVCYSCGEDWDVVALAGHVIDCPKQRRDAIARMPSTVPRPVMKLRKPDLPIPEESADVIDVLFYNMQSREIWEESFVDCPVCKKSFPSTWDGIAKHVIEDCQRKDPKVPLEDVPVTPRSDRAESTRSRFDSDAPNNNNSTSDEANAASTAAATTTTPAAGTGLENKRPSPVVTTSSAAQGASPPTDTVSPRSKQEPQTSPRERAISLKKTRASTLTDTAPTLGRARSTSTHEFAARALGVSPRGSAGKLDEAERGIKSSSTGTPYAEQSSSTATLATTAATAGSATELPSEEKEVTQQILSQALLETVSTIVTRTFGDRAPNKMLNFEAGFSSAHLPLSPLLGMGAGQGPGAGDRAGRDHAVKVQPKAAPLPIFRKGRDVNKVFPQVQARRTVYRRRKDLDPIAPLDHLHTGPAASGPGAGATATTALQQHWGGAPRIPPLNKSGMTGDHHGGAEMASGSRRTGAKPAVPVQTGRAAHEPRAASIRALPTRASEANSLRASGAAGEPRRPVVPLGTSQLQKRHHRNLRRRVGPPVGSHGYMNKHY